MPSRPPVRSRPCRSKPRLYQRRGIRPTGRGADWQRVTVAEGTECSSGGFFTRLASRSFDSPYNTDMAAAAADIVVQRLGDLHPRRRGVAIEQRLGRDQDAGKAIAALPRLLVEKRLL